MRVPKTVIVTAAVAAVALVPAGASAGPVKGVKSEVKQANAALKNAKQAALAGDRQAVYDQLAALGEHAKRAEGKARRIKRLADDRKDRKVAARAYKKVVAQYDRDIGAFAGILDQVGPQIQAMVAQALVLTADAQERAIEMLTRFAERLPDGARENVLAAIERFETDDDLPALIGALTSPDVTAGVKSLIGEHLEGVFDHVDSLIAHLSSFDPEAAAQAGEMVAMLREHLDGVFSMVEGLLGGLLGGQGGEAEAGFGSIADLLSGLLGGGSFLGHG